MGYADSWNRKKGKNDLQITLRQRPKKTTHYELSIIDIIVQSQEIYFTSINH